MNSPVRTLSQKQMLRERRQAIAAGEWVEPHTYERPSSREECRFGDRPCLYVACRFHLFLDVNPRTGSIKFNFPGKEVHELEETCALDVAERGGITLEDVGGLLNLTRERVRQLEAEALKDLAGLLGLEEDEVEALVAGRPE